MSQSPEEGADTKTDEFLTRSEELSEMLRQGRSWSGHERNCAFLNLGADVSGNQFAEVAGLSGFDFDDDARAIAILDWDGDGDLDLWARNRNAPQLRLMRNNSNTGDKSFVAMQLVGDGKTTNRDAIGARVEMRIKDSPHLLVRTVRAGEGFVSQSSKWLHFGLGEDGAEIESVRVRWPDAVGTEEIIKDIQPGGRYLVQQGKPTSDAPATERIAFAPRPMPVELPDNDGRIRVSAVARFGSPNIRYTDLNGRETEMPRHTGRWKLVNLWATWCVPCVAELADFAKHAEDLRSAGIDPIALSVDSLDGSPDPKITATATEIVSRTGFPFATGVADHKLVKDFQFLNDIMTGINRELPVPTSFLVNPNNQIAAIYKGSIEVDQILEDAKVVDPSPSERLLSSMNVGGTLIPLPEVRAAQVTRHAKLQATAGSGNLIDSPDASAAFYEESLRLDPNQHDVRMLFGIALNEGGYLDLATTQFRQLVDTSEDHELDGAAVYQLSTIALKRGKIADAMDLLEDALRRQSDHILALNNLAYLLATGINGSKPDLPRATELIERAVKLSESKVASVLDTQGTIYIGAGRSEEARIAYQKALKVARTQGQTTLATKIEKRLKTMQVGE